MSLSEKNVFRFEKSDPFAFLGGTMHRATKSKFPVLKGLAIQSLHLKAGAVREPHVHPNANQLDYCVSGKARVGIVGPNQKQLLDLAPGDISFVPQGHLHWIENRGKEALHFLVILSNEEPQTIELSEMLIGVPRDTLSKALRIKPELLDGIPKKKVTIGNGPAL